MVSGRFPAKKLRFYISVSAVYALTLIFAANCLHLGGLNKAKPSLVYANPVVATPQVSTIVVTTGKPVRVVVPRLGIDLPVDEGVYDEANKNWTLLGNHAYFALPSMLANDVGGNTLIYGHNNKDVFGKLVGLVPTDLLQIYTDNGRVFDYTYAGSDDVQPDNTSIFAYQGPPRATVQTCTGAWNEIRRMYHFNFAKVEQ